MKFTEMDCTGDIAIYFTLIASLDIHTKNAPYEPPMCTVKQFTSSQTLHHFTQCRMQRIFTLGTCVLCRHGIYCYQVKCNQCTVKSATRKEQQSAVLPLGPVQIGQKCYLSIHGFTMHLHPIVIIIIYHTLPLLCLSILSSFGSHSLTKIIMIKMGMQLPDGISKLSQPCAAAAVALSRTELCQKFENKSILREAFL